MTQPYLSPEMARRRYEKTREVEELGWGQVERTETYDADRDRVTATEVTLDLYPGTGLVLDTLEHKAPLMNVDQLVDRLGRDHQARRIDPGIVLDEVIHLARAAAKGRRGSHHENKPFTHQIFTP